MPLDWLYFFSYILWSTIWYDQVLMILVTICAVKNIKENAIWLFTQIARFLGPTWVGLTWVLSAPDGPHVGPMNLAIRVYPQKISKEHIEHLCITHGSSSSTVSTVILSGFPDSKVCGANMGPIWGRQDPGGRHVGLINLVIWVLWKPIN